jgi:hypothetical protein
MYSRFADLFSSLDRWLNACLRVTTKEKGGYNARALDFDVSVLSYFFRIPDHSNIRDHIIGPCVCVRVSVCVCVCVCVFVCF